MEDPDRYSDFEILRGTALLQSGELKSIDIADKYHIEKTVMLREDKNRSLDIADAFRKIDTAYISKRDDLKRGFR